MQSPFLTLNRGEIDYRRVFVYVLAFEFMILAVMLTGDTFLMAGLGAAVLVPLILLLLPKEPVIGIPLMFVATGLDFFGTITEQSSLFTFTYFHIVMVLTFLSVFLHYFLSGERRIPSCSLWAPFYAYLLVVALTLTFTPLFAEGFMELIRLFILGGLTFAIIMSIRSKAHVSFVSWSYVIVPAIVSLYVLYEIVTEGQFYQAQVIRVATELGIPVYRSTGTFHNPNVLALFITAGIVIGFSLLLVRELGWVKRTVLLVSVGICSVALVATFSRGGWIATAAGIFLVILLHRRWSYFFYFLGLFLVAMALLAVTHLEIVLAFVDRFLSIFEVSQEASASSRLSLIRMGIWMWQDNPVLGVGAAGYSYYAPEYIDPDMPRALSYVVLPHTIQIKILAEEGLIGLTMATWFFITIVFHGIRTSNQITDNFMKNMQIAVTSLVIAFMVGFTVNSDMHNNLFFITIGVLYAIPLVSQESIGETSGEKKTVPGS